MADYEITRDQFTFWKSIEVRWGDMDLLGHVNNTVYFVYLESARVEWLRQLGVTRGLGGASQGPTLVTVTCDFKKQVVYPAIIDVGVRVEKVGRSSFQMTYGLFLNGTDQLVARASSVNAWTDYAVGRAISLPDELRAKLSNLTKSELITDVKEQ
jgi:acyl-CoA thioester hydrolase